MATKDPLLDPARLGTEGVRGRGCRAPTTRALAFMAILVLAMGCGLGEALADYGDPAVLQASDVVGTWHSGDRRAIVFDEDGSFDATDLPAQAFHGLLPENFDPARDRLDGSGEWTLEPPLKEGASSAVTLIYRQLGGQPVDMNGPQPAVLQYDGVVRLVFVVSSGGGHWTAYEKCASECN